MAEFSFQSPRGTHDILPEQSAEWRFVENTFREICRRYNYGEIRTPMFEATELFTRTVGAGSDVLVTKQMYSFIAPDEASYTLRPEGTAPVVRAYLEHHLHARGPVSKLYYIGPIFRYEAPQAGRYRQHHQVGIELLGAASPEADAEVLALAADFLGELGIESQLHLNTLGTPVSRTTYLQKLKAYLAPRRSELTADSQRRLDVNPLRIFDSKEPRDQQLLEAAPRLLDHLHDEDAESLEHFAAVRAHLDRLGISYQVDPMLVRGFDYYTRTAFEFISSQLGAQSTVLGGGRYDGLVQELGGDPTPGIGFGCGIERLLLVRRASAAEPDPSAPLQAFLVTMGETARAAGVALLRQLRNAGITCDCDYVGRSVKAQMREANRQAARFTLILGDNELNAGTISIKDMSNSAQDTVPLTELEGRLAH